MALIYQPTDMTGTEGGDVIFPMPHLTGPNNTLQGLGGNDIILGDYVQAFGEIGNGYPDATDITPSMFPGLWNFQETTDIQNSTTVAHTTVYEVADQQEYWVLKIFMTTGQTLTLDVDYGTGFGQNQDFEIGVVSPDLLTEFTEDDDSPTTSGGTGSISILDSFVEWTATETGYHYIVWGDFSDGGTPLVPTDIGVNQVGDDGVLQISLTGVGDLSTTPEELNALIEAGAVIEGGADEIWAGAGRDWVWGLEGDDSIYGEDDGDHLYGGTGDDYIDGGLGGDTIDGGTGDDMIQARGGKDYVAGKDGADMIFGQAGRDVLNGNAQADEIYGQAAADRLFGGGGKDTVNGGGGDDVLRGGKGRDRLIGGDDDDVLHGDDAVDLSYGGNGADILNGNAGDDKLNGQAGADRLFGGGGDDVMTGGGGKDYLRGGKGNDRLNGGDGDDTLEGGAGADAFVFKNFNPNDRDVIVDFGAADTILLKGAVPVDISDVPTGALIAFANGYEILVKGVDASDLGADDFDYI